MIYIGLRKRLFGAVEKPFRDDERASFAASKSLFCNALCASWLRGCFFFVSVHVPFVSLAFVLMRYVSRVFVSPEGCPLSCFHDYGVTSTVVYLHVSDSFFDSYFCECKSDMLSLHKISFGSAIASLIKLRFQNLLLHSPCIIFA